MILLTLKTKISNLEALFCPRGLNPAKIESTFKQSLPFLFFLFIYDLRNLAERDLVTYSDEILFPFFSYRKIRSSPFFQYLF